MLHELLATTIDGAARVARQRVTTAATASPRHRGVGAPQTQYLPRIMIDLARGRRVIKQRDCDFGLRDACAKIKHRAQRLLIYIYSPPLRYTAPKRFLTTRSSSPGPYAWPCALSLALYNDQSLSTMAELRRTKETSSTNVLNG